MQKTAVCLYFILPFGHPAFKESAGHKRTVGSIRRNYCVRPHFRLRKSAVATIPAFREVYAEKVGLVLR